MRLGRGLVMGARVREAGPVAVRCCLALAAACWSASAAAQEGQLRVPDSLAQELRPLADVPGLETPAVDGAALLAEDAAAASRDVPFRFASPFPVNVTPADSGLWEESGGGATSVWRLRVRSPGALSMNLGFERYSMPRGGRLSIYTPDYETVEGPFTEADNESHGELWTPVVPGDEVVVEAAMPTDLVGELQLELGSVNRGYKDAFSLQKEQLTCNLDVACPAAEGYRDIIRSVGRISIGGTGICTGALLNNTSQDGRPYLLTAHHCRIDERNASSVVVYWNYQSPVCGALSGGRLDQYQTGAYFRASHAATDFTLIELDDVPDTRHYAYWAGWDRSPANPSRVVGIHHPRGREKAISIEAGPLTTTSYLQSRPSDGSHIMVSAWDQGTTEGGSSGSPLFDQDQRVVGQLHGGEVGCGINDWYGRLSGSWEGGGTRETRLRGWLDPAGTGAMTLAGRDAGADPGTVAGAPEVPVVDPGGSGPVWTDFELSDAHLRRIAYGLSAVTVLALLVAFATPRRRIAGAVQRMSRPVVHLADVVRRDSWGRVHVHPPPDFRPKPSPGPPPGPPPDRGRASFTVGRGRECDVRMEHDSVSRVHAEVERLSGGRLHVTDRRSTNGTFVLAGGEWRPIRQQMVAPGDRVRFGAYALTGDALDARCAAALAARRRGGGSPAREEQAVDRGQDVVRDPETGEVVKRGG